MAQRLKELMRFAFFESCGTDDPMFIKGFARGSRTHRVLLPFAAVHQILTCAVERRTSALEQKAWIEFDQTEFLAQRMWRLQGGLQRACFSIPPRWHDPVDREALRPAASWGQPSSAKRLGGLVGAMCVGPARS